MDAKVSFEERLVKDFATIFVRLDQIQEETLVTN